ncbi:MAG: DUF4252 domain-containing protein [Paludibacter sp.]|nr:DUF4252 domain-containing protein [Paludibacter sp.]
MKKVLTVLTVLFAVNQAIAAQSVESFIADFAKFQGVETTKVDSEMLAAAKANSEDSDDFEGLEKLKNVDVMKADNPSAELLEKCVNFISSFTQDVDYDTLIKVSEGGDKVLILSSKAENTEKSMIVIAVGNDGIAVVRINGEIDLNDISF